MYGGSKPLTSSLWYTQLTSGLPLRSPTNPNVFMFLVHALTCRAVRAVSLPQCMHAQP